MRFGRRPKSNSPRRQRARSWRALRLEALEERRVLSATGEAVPASLISINDPIYWPPPFMPWFAADDAEWLGGMMSYHPTQLVVAYEYINDTGGVTGAHSATNPANWQLTRDGVDVSNLITSISFGVQSWQFALSAVQLTPTATLTLSAPLVAGDYQLTAHHVLQFSGAESELTDTFSVSSVATAPLAKSYPSQSTVASRAMAGNASGNYVAAWASAEDFLFPTPIYANRAHADGTRDGDTVEVATDEVILDDLSVSENASGAFVVAWSGSVPPFNQTSVKHAYVRLFASDGTAQGPAIDFGADTDDSAVTRFDDGSLVVTWLAAADKPVGQQELWAQRFRANGTALSDPIRIAQGVSTENPPKIAGDRDDEAVILWQANNTFVAQRFEADFTRIGSAITADATLQSFADVAMDPAGDFVLVAAGTRALHWGRFDQEAQTWSGTRNVAPASFSFSIPKIAMDQEGNCLLVWANSGSSPYLQGEVFDSSGHAVAEPLDLLRGQGAFNQVGYPLPIMGSPGHAWAVLGDEESSPSGDNLWAAIDRPLTLPLPPKVDLNGPVAGTNFAANAPPGSRAVALTDHQSLSLFAISGQLSSASITIADAQPGDSLIASTQGTNIHQVYAAGVLTLSGSDSTANYQKVLRTVALATSVQRPVGSHIIVSFVVNDGQNASPAATSTISIYSPGQTTVTGRHIFYNDSSLDGHNAATNAQDDAAIAPDKHVLLPGQAASFTNYTSYSRGLNGLMIDLAGKHGTITADDFTFKVGNLEEPDSWSIAPPPLSIVVRAGAGLNGSDRVEIIWPDNGIADEWLQVTLRANGDTGLAADDTFFVGNAIGEAGNSSTDADVTPQDSLKLINRLLASGAAIPTNLRDAGDYDRDLKVSPQDLLVVFNRLLTEYSQLSLLAAPAQSGASGFTTFGDAQASQLRLPADELPAPAVDAAIASALSVTPSASPILQSTRQNDASGQALDRQQSADAQVVRPSAAESAMREDQPRKTARGATDQLSGDEAFVGFDFVD